MAKKQTRRSKTKPPRADKAPGPVRYKKPPKDRGPSALEVAAGGKRPDKKR